MDKIRELIGKKPRFYVYASVSFLLGIILIKWLFHPSIEALWFFVGGVLGIYFLDAAELFFALNPSPFRSIVFFALFAAVSFFVITSSTSRIGAGLVLSLYLQMLLWQAGEWRIVGNLDSWYRLVAGSVPRVTQRAILFASAAVLLLETFLFIR